MPTRLPRSRADLAHDRHARVAALVNAMTEAHDLRLFRERIHHPAFGAIRGLDLVEHLHRLLVRAAVERAFQRSARARDRRIHVGQRRGGDARGEGRGVEFVIGVKDENRVHHPDLPIRRHFAAELVKEIARQRQIGPFRQRILAVLNPKTVRDQRRHLRDQAHRLADVGVVRVIVQFGIERRRASNSRSATCPSDACSSAAAASFPAPPSAANAPPRAPAKIPRAAPSSAARRSAAGKRLPRSSPSPPSRECRSRDTSGRRSDRPSRFRFRPRSRRRGRGCRRVWCRFQCSWE